MCEGLSKISGKYTLHLIEVGKLNWFKENLSDLKTILMADLADLWFLDHWEMQHMSVNLNYVAGKIALS